jgi:hypothetical protein
MKYLIIIIISYALGAASMYYFMKPRRKPKTKIKFKAVGQDEIFIDDNNDDDLFGQSRKSK